MWWSQAKTCDVLVVCTGNVCRSPYVAARLAHELPGLVVVSAGTGALVGEPPTPQIQALLRKRDVDGPTSRARRLNRRTARSARLVLTAEGRHRAEVVRLSPTAAERAFTLLELARLLRAVGSPNAIGLHGVLDVAQRQLRLGDEADHPDDLADPYGMSDNDYTRMAASADHALAVVVPALREPDRDGT